MARVTVLSFEQCFADLDDPRVVGRCLHRLNDILIIALCAMLCGAEDWDAIAQFGRAKEAFFKRLLELPNGIPSADTFARVFSMISPRQFEACFRRWVNAVLADAGQEQIAIDGKTMRRSHGRRAGQPPLHIVSAFAAHSHLVLGQVKTEEKSNEITAIPQLLEQLLLRVHIPPKMTADSEERDRLAHRFLTGEGFLLRAVTIGQLGGEFPHRLAPQVEAVRAMEKPVENGIGQGCFTDVVVPVLGG